MDYLTQATARFGDDRLLVYSNGQFQDAPSGGQVLSSIREFKDSR
jgi:hypothetical protein